MGKFIIAGLGGLLVWLGGWALVLGAAANFLWLLVKDVALFPWFWLVYALAVFVVGLATYFIGAFLFITRK